MVCGGCVYKLAKRLVKNHPRSLDWIHAVTLAYKGVERAEQRKCLDGKNCPPPSYDYRVICYELVEEGGTCECTYLFETCIVSLNNCTCTSCPDIDPTHSNNHLVSDECITNPVCGEPEACPCGWGSCLGYCYYDCDEDFEWDGDDCVPVAPPPEKPLINKPLVNPTLINPPIVRTVPFSTRR